MRASLVVMGLGILLSAAGSRPVAAIELSHYSALPGIAFNDDYFMPPEDAGRLIYAQYNSYYGTDTLRDAGGESIDEVTVTGPLGRPQTVQVDVDFDNWVIAPVLMWLPRWDVLGARYGAFVMVPVGNPSIAANLETRFERGLGVEDSTWGLADLYAQPLWLQWRLLDRADVTFGYGFWAASGKYEAGATDNVGLGFWSHTLQTALRLPFGESAAAMLALTGEINHNKEGADIVPGSHMTLNWGVRKHFFEDWLQLGFTAYDTWQVSDDSGSDVTRTDHDQVHAAGVQLGVPKLGLAVKYMHEYGAEDRFEGQMVSILFAIPLEQGLRWLGL